MSERLISNTWKFHSKCILNCMKTSQYEWEWVTDSHSELGKKISSIRTENRIVKYHVEPLKKIFGCIYECEVDFFTKPARMNKIGLVEVGKSTFNNKTIPRECGVRVRPIKVTVKHAQPVCSAEITTRYEKQLARVKVEADLSRDMWWESLLSKLNSHLKDDRRVVRAGSELIIERKVEKEVMNSKYKYWERIDSINLTYFGIEPGMKITDLDIKSLKLYIA